MKTFRGFLMISCVVLVVAGFSSQAAAWIPFTSIADVNITSHQTGDIVFAGKSYTLTCTTSTDEDCNDIIYGPRVWDTVIHTWSGGGTFISTTGTNVTWTAPNTVGDVNITVTADDSPIYYDDDPKTDTVTLTVINLESYDSFGMEVNSVTLDSGVVTVKTTGATYVLSSTGMDMYRRIDPNTNEIDPSNDGKGRKVAQLDFSTNIGTISISSQSSKTAVIDSNYATFDFISDSMFFITAKASFDITHTNLISGAPWNAPLDSNERGLDRLWTDGYGGSLHAKVSQSTAPTLDTSDTNSTRFDMSIGDMTAHMVFPPKLYDFENLYDANSRPFVDFIYHKNFMDNLMETGGMDTYINNGFGVFLLFANLYGNDTNYVRSDCFPETLDSDPNIIGYNVAEPSYIKNFVSSAHSNGFKVITYLANPSHSTWNGQDIAVTLEWMREFQEEYDFDGWYFDNADTGDLIDDYAFMRRVRTDVGNDGIIFNHDSVDVWSMTGANYSTGYKGLKAIMADVYVNYTFAGETGTIVEVDSPNDEYFRFYTSGYGMSQAYGNHIMATNGKTALVPAEERRVMGQNLNGFHRASEVLSNQLWLTSFKPVYDLRKSEYLNDANVPFDPDVDWPIDPNNGWFRTPTNISVTDVNSNSAKIIWTTSAVADSNVAYTSDEIWWSPDGPDGTVSDSNMTTSHSITLTGLNSNTADEYRIRSNNGDANIPGEIIWGYVGNFTTD